MMTRLFGCICNEPHRIGVALEPVRDALVAPGPVARWGLGYVQAGEVLLQRHPRGTEEEVDFFSTVERIKSDYIVGCASAADGLSGNANTQPFRYRRWLFAQESGIDRFDLVQPRILERTPEFLRRTIAGKTAAEHIFSLFLSVLYDGGGLDDPNLPVGHIRRALRDTVAQTGRLVRESGAPDSPLGNVVLTNSRSMLAARLDLPIYVRRFKQIDTRRSDNRHFRAVLVVSSAVDPGEGFEEIPRGAVLIISRDLQTDITDLEA